MEMLHGETFLLLPLQQLLEHHLLDMRRRIGISMKMSMADGEEIGQILVEVGIHRIHAEFMNQEVVSIVNLLKHVLIIVIVKLEAVLIHVVQLIAVEISSVLKPQYL